MRNHRIICPNCGFDGNTADVKYCGVCYYPFERMDGFGNIKSNFDYMILKKSSKSINFITWCVIAVFSLGVAKMYKIYKDAIYEAYESNTINAITARKEMVVKMYSASQQQDAGNSSAGAELSAEKQETRLITQQENSGRIRFGEDINLREPDEISFDMKNVRTPNFIIFCDNNSLRLELSQDIEGIFDMIIKDLGFFSAWNNRRQMKVYIFSNASEYHKHSLLPEWSAGYASLNNMAVYLYESEQLGIVFPHELSHLIFYIFMENKIDLSKFSWLLEGVAVYVEMKTNPQAYQNAGKYMAHLAKNGKLQKLEEFVNINIYNVNDEEIVKKWYLQAGSLVNYIISAKGSLRFYNFCNGLKIFNGDIYQSLNYAFSGEFNTLGDLEKHYLAYLKTQ